MERQAPAILLNISKEAGANVIETADRIRALLPQLMEWLPRDIKLTVVADRTTTIRASVDDVQYTLGITIVMVLLVVLLFMRRLMPTVAAAVTVPLSLCGTLAGMWFLGYTVDNFSLMALTISVGFVVDDAIVMIENIIRHIEQGVPPLQAALIGARQIGFTVLSISISLVAVFIPLIFMGGILGRLFHEFAMTHDHGDRDLRGGVAVADADAVRPLYAACASARSGRSGAALDRGNGSRLPRQPALLCTHAGLGAASTACFMLLVTLLTVVLTVRLYTAVPKGFLPLQDTGILTGSTQASPDISFTAMEDRQRAVVDVLLADPAVATVVELDRRRLRLVVDESRLDDDHPEAAGAARRFRPKR